MSATKTTIVAVLVVVLTFTAGVMVGVFGTHLRHVFRGPEPPYIPTNIIVNRLDRRLDLTDAQRTQVEEIIRRRHARIEAAWSDLYPRVHAEIEQANAEITRVLTPEQRKTFERMKLHLGSRHRDRHDRGRERSTR